MPDPDVSGGPSRIAPDGRLLLLGASARALAASAARSREATRLFPRGLLAIDYFGDTDLAGAAPTSFEVTVVSVHRDLGLPRTTASLGRAALASAWSSLAYAGGIENRPGLVRLLARRSDGAETLPRVLGNDAKALAAVRDPRRLFPLLHAIGLPHAAVRFGDALADGWDADAWLVKTRRSAGGAGVRAPIEGAVLPPGRFLQERLRGPVGSACFVADGRQAVLLGVSEQISGWEALGAREFRYAGNIAGPSDAFLSSEALDLVAATARRVTERFGLRGLNGLDYVVHRGVPRLIEVNPRWTASMELIEERTGRNLFDRHLRASEGAGVATHDAWEAREGNARPALGRFLAKGILYATETCVAPDPRALEALGARDRPHLGERIESGEPICTLIVEGDDADDCRSRLEKKAALARARLAPA
jgi:predicted ATP-grasp superfamily ATP-dependent carboligase